METTLPNRLSDLVGRYVNLGVRTRGKGGPMKLYKAYLAAVSERYLYLADSPSMVIVWAVPPKMFMAVGEWSEGDSTPPLRNSSLRKVWDVLYGVQDPPQNSDIKAALARFRGKVKKVK